MILSVVLGALVGVIAALTGAGGGILAVPLLIVGLHLTLAQAGPIALMATGASAALGALLAHWSGLVRYRAAALMAMSGMLVTPVGLWVAARVPTRPLTLVFALVLAYVGYRTYKRSSMEAVPASATDHEIFTPCKLDARIGRLIWTIPCARVLAGWGMMVGFLSGLLGVGGGFVIVPTLQRYTDLEMRAIVPTSLAVIALVSIAGVVSSAIAGVLIWPIALPFSGGALLGMLAGRMVTHRLSGAMLQKGFAALCVVVAIGLGARSVMT
ncbi:MAG: sulfite exporter TauE/SafE family protein [Herminiimonas sp.]|nr:sulfite exporter TauE/SafE family protein [Herminiimonas sp.]